MQFCMPRLSAVKSLALAGAFAAPMAMAVPAAGQDTLDEGWYIQGQGGLNVLRDMKLDGGAAFDNRADMKRGFAGMIGIGYDFLDLWRAELEYGYRRNNVDSISGAANSTGKSKAHSLMANLFADIDIGDSPVTPFVGLGVGAARVSVDGFSPVGGSRINDRDTSIAGQLMAGLNVDVAPDLALTGRYTFLYAPNVDVRTDSGVGVDSKYRSHAFTIGLRYTFWRPPAPPPPPEPEPVAEPAPPPPPPPPPPEPEPEPEIVRDFIVFFDWDSSELSAEARAIIRQAYDYAMQGGVARIAAVGHADRSGPAVYNMGLSQRRADSVRAEFVRLGFPADGIVTEARGEEDPLVPTADGVREPQNRRVEIGLE